MHQYKVVSCIIQDSELYTNKDNELYINSSQRVVHQFKTVSCTPIKDRKLYTNLRQWVVHQLYTFSRPSVVNFLKTLYTNTRQ